MKGPITPDRETRRPPDRVGRSLAPERQTHDRNNQSEPDQDSTSARRKIEARVTAGTELE